MNRNKTLLSLICLFAICMALIGCENKEAAAREAEAKAATAKAEVAKVEAVARAEEAKAETAKAEAAKAESQAEAIKLEAAKLEAAKAEAAEKPVNVSGQIFVVTKGRENIKMGMLGVHVLTEADLKTIGIAIAANRAIIDELSILYADVKSSVSPDRFVPAMRDLENKIESLKSHEYLVDVVASQLPPPITKTDADGRFTIPVKSKIWVAAYGERLVGKETERYLWIRPCELTNNSLPAPLMISTDSEIESDKVLLLVPEIKSGADVKLVVDQETKEKARKENKKSLLQELNKFYSEESEEAKAKAVIAKEAKAEADKAEEIAKAKKAKEWGIPVISVEKFVTYCTFGK